MVYLQFREKIFLGGFEIEGTGKWFWWSNSGGLPEQIKTFHWASGEPNNANGEEGCLVTGQEGSFWNDVQCFSKFKALCEFRCD